MNNFTIYSGPILQHGGLPVFSGSKFQNGGLSVYAGKQYGSSIGNILNGAIPHIKTLVKDIGNKALTKGKQMAPGLVKKAIKRGAPVVGDRVIKKLSPKMQKIVKHSVKDIEKIAKLPINKQMQTLSTKGFSKKLLDAAIKGASDTINKGTKRKANRNPHKNKNKRRKQDILS